MDAFLMMIRARKIVEVCTAIKPGEKVVIVTDSSLIEIADVLAAAAHERDAEVVIAVMAPTGVDGAEPPRVVVEAMKAADVAILPVSYSIIPSAIARASVRRWPPGRAWRPSLPSRRR